MLKEGAVPHALYTPRNSPIHLRDKVREELARMEAMGVISSIQELPPGVQEWWLFKTAKRECTTQTSPIPKVDET